MPAIEIAAPDVESAINQGLSQLKLIRAEVTIEVLDEGARGVLGIGSRPAKVRLTPYAEVEARTRAAAMAAMQAPPPPVAPPPPPPPPPPPRAPAPQPVMRQEPEAPAEQAPLPRREPDARPLRRAPLPRQVEPRPARPPRSAESEEPVTAPEGAAELARDIAQGIVERMGLDVVVEAQLQEPRASDDTLSLYVNVSGPDAETLLTYQSEGLNALQTMIQTMWAHQAKSSLRITVDADGYKAARERRIRQMAQRMEERVISSGRPVTLEPMPASERRFVHLALRDDDRIYTESQGEGASRKVVIKLKQQ